MIHHFGGPGLIFASIVAAIGELTSRKRRKSSSTIKAEEKFRQKKRVSAAQKMVAEHADCTAEVFNVMVLRFPQRQYLRDLKIGDKVDLRRYDEVVELWSKGKKICDLIVPETSHLPYLFDHNVKMFAFLGGKDPNECLLNFTSAQIIVFYQLPGVPPTKVNIDTSSPY